MKNSIIQLSLLAFLVAAVAGAPNSSLAQNTDQAPADKKSTQTNDTSKAEKSTKGGPFRGKLAAVDKVAKTITVGKRTFQITSETKIKKAGKPALLEDGVVGETVNGYVKPTAHGKWNATTVNFGAKAASDTTEKVPVGADKEKEAK